MTNHTIRGSQIGFAVLAAAIFLASLTGCNDLLGAGTGGEGGGSSKSAVKSTDKTVFLGSFTGVEFINAFKERFTNTANKVDKTTKVVVISGDYSPTSPDMQAVAEAYQNGAVIVLVRPTGAQQSALTAAIEDRTTLSQNTGDKPECDMYAFNRFDDHHILNMHPYNAQYFYDESSVEVQKDDNGTVISTVEKPSKVVNPDPEHPTPGELAVEPPARANIDYDPFFDIFVRWIDGYNNNEKPAVSAPRSARSATSSDVQHMMNAQTFGFTYNATPYLSFNGHNINSIAVTNDYRVWALYDFDNEEDYYIIEEDISIPNGSLFYRTNEMAKDKSRYTGFYMSGVYADNYLADSLKSPFGMNEMSRVLATPETQNGKVTNTQGKSWGVNGNLGFNAQGFTGAFGASATYTSTVSTTVDELGAYNNCGTTNHDILSGEHPNARWDYQLKVYPTASDKVHIGYPHWCEIGDAPDIARNTASFHHSWIWKIPTAKNSPHMYEIRPSFRPSFAYTYGKASWSDWKTGNPSAGVLYSDHHLLTPPPRTPMTNLKVVNNSSDYIEKVEVWKQATDTSKKNADFIFEKSIPHTGANNFAEITVPIANGYKVRLTVREGNQDVKYHSKAGGFSPKEADDAWKSYDVYFDPSGSTDFVAGDF